MLYNWLGPGKGKEADIRKSDFDESHAVEEIRCSNIICWRGNKMF